jgi:hypothetical protein
MNREFRRIMPKFSAIEQPRRTTRAVAQLPKGSREILRRFQGKRSVTSPSLPHSKSFGK